MPCSSLTSLFQPAVHSLFSNPLEGHPSHHWHGQHDQANHRTSFRYGWSYRVKTDGTVLASIWHAVLLKLPKTFAPQKLRLNLTAHPSSPCPPISRKRRLPAAARLHILHGKNTGTAGCIVLAVRCDDPSRPQWSPPGASPLSEKLAFPGNGAIGSLPRTNVWAAVTPGRTASPQTRAIPQHSSTPAAWPRLWLPSCVQTRPPPQLFSPNLGFRSNSNLSHNSSAGSAQFLSLRAATSASPPSKTRLQCISNKQAWRAAAHLATPPERDSTVRRNPNDAS